MFNAPPSVLVASKKNAIKESLMNLLIKEKKEGITIKCGLRVMDLVQNMAECTIHDKTFFLFISGCWIKVEKDFDLDPDEIWYNDVIIFE